MNYVTLIAGIVSIAIGAVGLMWNKERLILLAEKNEFPKRDNYKLAAYFLILMGVIGVIASAYALWILPNIQSAVIETTSQSAVVTLANSGSKTNSLLLFGFGGVALISAGYIFLHKKTKNKNKD